VAAIKAASLFLGVFTRRLTGQATDTTWAWQLHSDNSGPEKLITVKLNILLKLPGDTTYTPRTITVANLPVLVRVNRLLRPLSRPLVAHPPSSIRDAYLAPTGCGAKGIGAKSSLRHRKIATTRVRYQVYL
jgi:hypothetical protein